VSFLAGVVRRGAGLPQAVSVRPSMSPQQTEASAPNSLTGDDFGGPVATSQLSPRADSEDPVAQVERSVGPAAHCETPLPAARADVWKASAPPAPPVIVRQEVERSGKEERGALADTDSQVMERQVPLDSAEPRTSVVPAVEVPSRAPAPPPAAAVMTSQQPSPRENRSNMVQHAEHGGFGKQSIHI